MFTLIIIGALVYELFAAFFLTNFFIIGSILEIGVIVCCILSLISMFFLCSCVPFFICMILIFIFSIFSIGLISNCNLIVLTPIFIIGFLMTCSCIILFSTSTLLISLIRFLIIFSCILLFICILSLVIIALIIISALLFFFMIIIFYMIVITIITSLILSLCLEVIACLFCGQIPYLPFDFIRDWKFMLIISLFSNRINFLTTSYIDSCKSIMEKLK